MKLSVIILAAGKGKRFHGMKQFYKLFGREIIDYSIKKFDGMRYVYEILVVLPRGFIDKYRERYKGLHKKIKFVIGGRERYDSVKNALKVVSVDCDYVCVHDSVRPFFSKNLFLRLVRNLKNFDAVIPAIGVKDTIKVVKDGFVEYTIDRSKIVAVQTPQVFKKDVLLQAYSGEIPIETTDDSYLVERLNVPVKIIKGEEKNIKITTIQDILFAKRICRNN